MDNVMSMRESSSEVSQRYEKLEDRRFRPYLKISAKIDFCPSDYFTPLPTAHMIWPPASAPQEPLYNASFSRVLTGVQELDLVPNRGPSQSNEKLEARMFLPSAPDYTANLSQPGYVPYPQAPDGYAPYPLPLSTTKSWSRAESGPFDWKQQARAQPGYVPYPQAPDGYAPYPLPLSTTKSWSRAESGPFDWKQQARAQSGYVPYPQAPDGYAPYPLPLSTTKSWSRAESGPFDWKQQARAQEFILSGKVELFGKVGLHCYNLQKGTNLQFLAVHKCQSWITSILSYFITLEAVDPMCNSSCEFETSARYAIENKGCLSAIVTECGIKPRNPDSEERCGHIPFDKALVDDFFKGEMPDWMRDGALTGSNKLQYYEMKESEVEEEKEWLHLYAELGLLSLPMSELKKVEDVKVKPFELRKIVVRTKEDVESKKKVKAENAIFYISFKTRCGLDFNVIVRKTTDGLPQHLSLEVKCF